MTTPNIRIRVTFDGTGAAVKQLKDGMATLIKTAAFDVEGRAKLTAPIDTGHLRATIQAMRRNEQLWVVLVGAEYGVYQEFGTRYMAAQPYFLPAVEATRRNMKQIAESVLRRG